MKCCVALDAERSHSPLVPPDDGGLTTETCRGDTDTNIQLCEQCAYLLVYLNRVKIYKV
jgi:hypothetical protein